MPPFLVALAVAAVIALIPRKNTVVGAPVAVPTTPVTGPVGVTTGFAQPPIQTSIPSSVAPPVQTNQPSASSSGVPNWTANAQEFNTAPYAPAPAPTSRIPGFYIGSIQANLQPIYTPVNVPVPAAQSSQSCSCGCSGSGCGCSQNPSDCSVASLRNMDGGCLAPTQAAQLASAPPGVLQQWAANLASAGVTAFQAGQQIQYDIQDTNPQGEDITVPASPHIQGIGISNRRPIRSAIFGYTN